MRKGERRAGVGTEAVNGSFGKERNESVEGKVEDMCLNGTPLKEVLIRNLPSCHRSPNLNIWEAPCRAMVARVQREPRG